MEFSVVLFNKYKCLQCAPEPGSEMEKLYVYCLEELGPRVDWQGQARWGTVSPKEVQWAQLQLPGEGYDGLRQTAGKARMHRAWGLALGDAETPCHNKLVDCYIM